MQSRAFLVCLIGIVFAPLALAATAKHTTVTLDRSGNPVEYTEMVADDSGNLRIETYSVSATADSSGTTYEREGLRDLVVFQAAEKKMLSVERGQCHAFSLDDAASGMQGVDMSQFKDEMTKAQAEMNKAFGEMAKENPEMAEMLKNQFGGQDGVASMTRPRNELTLEETDQTRTIGDYDTTRFDVTESSAKTTKYTVWAADIDDVEGGRLIGNATLNMMKVYKQLMDDIGVGALAGTGMAGVIMEKMEDYYPILTEDQDGQTKLISTDGTGTADFYPDCQ